MTLNVNAQPFVPPSVTQAKAGKAKKQKNHAGRHHQQQYFVTAFDTIEADVSPAELEELEAADEWVALQAEMELEEEDHLIAYALLNAPASVDWSAVDWKAVESQKSQTRS